MCEISKAIPDVRRGKNCHYSMQDIIMGGFSVFFMQNPSWLAYQKLLENQHHQTNVNTLFHCEKIASDNHIRNILDKINPSQFDSMYNLILNDLREKGYLEKFKVLGNKTLISVDGTTFFQSNEICCGKCLHKYHKKTDEYEFSHMMLGLSITSTYSKEVIPLAPIFVANSDLSESERKNNTLLKQNSEYKAFKFFCENDFSRIESLNPVIVGDALFGREPIIALLNDHSNANFIFSCKPGSNKTVYDFVDNGDLCTYKTIKRVKSNVKEEWIYEWLNNIPLTNSQTPLRVNYISLTITQSPNAEQIKKLEKKARKKSNYKTYENFLITKKFDFITDIDVSEENIEELIACGRSRWSLENEFNSLKTRGYNFEHNYGHGKLNLSNVIATFILLSFLMHTAASLTDELYNLAKNEFSNRKYFFHSLFLLTQIFIFSDFSSIFNVIIGNKSCNIYNDSS
ncbi:MAG: transposase family protein [Christensenellaceae bacterium]|nr:transposase family protein [Christensenellaceae bacterium]